MEDIAILFIICAALAVIVYKMYETATSKRYIQECTDTRKEWKNRREKGEVQREKENEQKEKGKVQREKENEQKEKGKNKKEKAD